MGSTLDTLIEFIRRRYGESTDPAPTKLTETEWAAVAGEAKNHEVVPFLYSTLGRIGEIDRVPPRVRKALHADYIRNSAFNARLLSQLRDVLAILSREGIRAVGLKGVHLLAEVYDDVGARRVGDVDLLLEESDAVAAARALLAAGYSATGEIRTDQQRSFSHHFPEFMMPGKHPVEIHWYPVNRDRLSPLDIDVRGVIDRSHEVRLDGGPVPLPSIEDLLIHLCLHHMYQHKFTLKLRHYVDILELMARQGPHLDLDAIAMRSDSWRVRKHVYTVLAVTARLFDTAVLDDLLSRVRPKDFDDRYVQWARERMFLPAIQTASRPRILCFHYIAASRKPNRIVGLVSFFRWAAFPPRKVIDANYYMLKSWPVPLIWLRNAWNSVRYLVRDVRTNREEMDRIAFEEWCSSRNPRPAFPPPWELKP